MIIKTNPKFVKGYYRKANALFKLDRYQECIQVCNQGLAIENDKDFINLRTKAETEYDKIANKIDKGSYIKQNDLGRTMKYLNKKGIRYSAASSVNLPQIYQPHFGLIGKKVVTSMIIFYPEFSQLDFIEQTNEGDFVFDILAEPLSSGLPWDENKYYDDFSSLKVFVVVANRDALNGDNFEALPKDLNRLVQITTTQKVIDVLTIKDYVVPKVLELYVLSTRSKFYNHFVGQYSN